jgi:hypothetical protein
MVVVLVLLFDFYFVLVLNSLVLFLVLYFLVLWLITCGVLTFLRQFFSLENIIFLFGMK